MMTQEKPEDRKTCGPGGTQGKKSRRTGGSPGRD